jgi:uncharacterized repeat protein (TIGR01451 family)
MTATASSDQTPDDTDDESVPVPTPSLDIVKSLQGNADEDGSNDVSDGDTLTYRFVVTNTGTANLTNVAVVDPLPGLSALSCVPGQPAFLAAGKSMGCTGTYVVTPDDVVAGEIKNTATASSDQTPDDTDDESVPVVWITVLALVPACASWHSVHAGEKESDFSAEAEQLKLAEVDGEVITLAELKAAFESRHAGHGAMLYGEAILRRVLEKAVDERLLILEGRRMGIHEEAGLVEAAEVYRDILRLKELESKLIQEPSEPSSREVKKGYKRLSKQVRVSIVDTRERGEAETALRRLRDGEEFDRVARETSIHKSRLRGGDLGWIGWGGLDPASETIAFKTPPGEIADPFPLEGGFRILKVLEERKVDLPPFEKVEAGIAGVLSRRRGEELREELLDSIRSSHPPSLNQEALERFLAAEGGTTGEHDPPDEVVLLTTAGGLELSAGKVRERARRRNLEAGDAWRAASTDALLIDEARRRIEPGPDLERKVRVFVDGRVLSEVERLVVLERVSVDEHAVRAFYEENRDSFAIPASFHLRHVLLGSRQEAEEARQRVEQNQEDFEELARQRSIDARTAASGGDLGWVRFEEPEEDGVIAEAVRGLRPGEISPVVEVPEGFGIIQLVEVRPARTPDFEEVRGAASRRLAKQKRTELLEEILARLREHSEIQVFEEGLERAVEIQEATARQRLSKPPPQTAPGER